jgi:hypothetical protein
MKETYADYVRSPLIVIVAPTISSIAPMSITFKNENPYLKKFNNLHLVNVL